MASFGWKRKIGEKVSKVTSQQFEAQAADEQGLVDNSEVDWLQEAKRKKGLLLEDCVAQSKHLKDEGAILAENGRYQEALHKWDEALQLTPEDATLYEMKSQVLMSLHEMFPAVQAAEMAVQRDPHSWEAWQTLGRAQLGLGEITLAIRSFQVALHIYPLNSGCGTKIFPGQENYNNRKRQPKRRQEHREMRQKLWRGQSQIMILKAMRSWPCVLPLQKKKKALRPLKV
uniref:Tetratricopeptide repeat domain 33 n=1 Tax=Naja naja TaxID=35670 RepID=A0A8C7DYV4_NAJNA